MHMYDVSLPISEGLPVWPGDPRVTLIQESHLDRGDPYTVTRLSMSAHTGTHVDAPAHCVPGGVGIDGLDLNLLIGPAWVIDVGEKQAITAEVLEGLSIPADAHRVLFRTRNSERWAWDAWEFDPSFVAIQPDGARWLVEQGIRLVGIDALSVAPFDDDVPTHRILLNAGVIVVEGLRLDGVERGIYHLICLPLPIVGSDGAPARVILIRDP